MEEQALPYEFKEETVYERLYRQSFTRPQPKNDTTRISQMSTSSKIADDLIEKGRLLQAKKNELRRKHEQEILHQLKNKPQINRRSEKLLKHKAVRDKEASQQLVFNLRTSHSGAVQSGTIQIKAKALPLKPNEGSHLYQSFHSTLSLEQAREYKALLEKRKQVLS